MKRRFLGSIAGAGVALVCLLTACSGGITTSEPIDMSWGSTATAAAGTTERTAKPTTPSIPTYTTSSRSTTATKKPWSEYDPDPVMSLEEYMSEMRLAGDERRAYDSIPNDGRVFVHYSGYMLSIDMSSPDSLHEGSIYWWNGTWRAEEDGIEEDFRLLRDCRAKTYAMKFGLGYTYVAVDGTIYRYKYDGTDETLIFEGERPIEALSGDSYALFFATDEGLYRLFRPTGQLDRLCAIQEQVQHMDMWTNDILGVLMPSGRQWYILSLDRWISTDALLAASGKDRLEHTRDFYRWVYTYCEEHPE